MNKLDLAFFGTPDIALPSLRALVENGHRVAGVYTQPDKPAGRGRKMLRCPVARLADELGLEVAQPAHVRRAIEEVRSLKAQAGVVVAFGQVLPQEVLEAFPLGCVNMHTSLLPKLRGASPINAAILEGHQRTGVTTMFMDQGLDTGDIIFQRALDIDPQETAGSLFDRLAVLGAGLLLETLEALERGDAPRIPQDHDQATMAPLMKKSDGVVDWNRDAAGLDRLIRGMDPWPSAQTSFRGKALKLYAPTMLDSSPSDAEPGSVLAPRLGRDDLLWLAAGQGCLGVGAVQAAGKRRMNAAEFMRGARPEPGERLGA